MNESDVAKAKLIIERVLVEKHPDYRTLTIPQAQAVFGMRTFDIWCAWMLLEGSKS